MATTSTPTTGTRTSSSSITRTTDADTKISNDLLVLKEKMDTLDSMLHPRDRAAPKLSVLTNDALRNAIGYLDACAPRMIQLVEACTSTSVGVLSEDLFGDVLGCNDRLQQLLVDVDTRLLTETPATTTAASAVPSSSSGATGAAAAAVAAQSTNNDNTTSVDHAISEEFGDLFLDDEDPFADDPVFGSGRTTTIAPAVPVAGAKTTGESDEFQVEQQTPGEQQQQQQQQVDPFDDFFAERTSK